MLELVKMKMIRIYQSEQDGVVRLYMPETNSQESTDTQELEVRSQE